MKNCRSHKFYSLMCKAFIVPALVCSFAAPAVIPASAADTKETGAADNASGTAAADSASDASAAASAAVPELILSKCYLLESDNYENIADGYYQAVLLTEESAKKFPALSSGLDAVNTRITASCKETFKELSEGSKEFNASNKKDGAPVPATLEYSIIPTRMDDKVVSFITS